MRLAAARATSSSMHTLLSAATVASGSLAGGCSAAEQRPCAAAASSAAPSSPSSQQRQWHSAASQPQRPFRPLYNDLARQRRLVVAAAAQPALAEEAWDVTAVPLPLQPRHAAAATPALPEPLLALEPLVPAAPPAAQPEFQLPVPNLGYTCMNTGLQQKYGIRTNRSCRRKTYEAEGLPRVSALALANCADLLPLVAWNAAHGIHFFRIPSALFPWSHEYELEQLPDYEEIAATLAAVGAAARAAHQRLTCHPSHFVQLASPDPALLARSMRDVELNARVFDLMGYPPSHTNKINIHVGAVHGSKPRSLARFAAAVERLSDGARARLTVENDDRPSQFSLDDLLPLHAMAGTPLVFDYLHHALVPGRLSEQEALFAALDTWPPGVRPVVHYSESSEDPSVPRRSHSCMLARPFELYGRDREVDVMLEAKGMERALLFYRDELQLGRKRRTDAVHYRALPGESAKPRRRAPRTVS